MYFQCVGLLISAIFGPLPFSLAISLHFLLFWLLALVQATFIALSITRIFLILRVKNIQ